jgi:BirA family biotin operon repressor/biotin-[acetyl-CoA-carboxylase] ligase
MPIDDRLDPDLIQANLKTRQIGRKVIVYDRTSSTNDVAAEYARNPDNAGLVVLAEEQTAGRGRSGAKWYGAHGDSLLFSIVLADCEVNSELLSLTCAVAVAEGIGQVGGHEARIRWPNDIVLAGRKIAGILLESKVRRRKDSLTCQVSSLKSSNFKPQTSNLPIHVVGIGINCHQTPDSLPTELRETATSLDFVSGTQCRRVLTSLDQWLRVAGRNKQQVIETWSRLSTQLGQRVTLSYNKRRFTGNCIGVDPEKGLILQLDHGGIRMFDAAHTHIIK